MNGGTKLKACLVISLFLLVIVCPAAAGQIIYVDTDAQGENDGSSWANAFNYLQDALAAAWSGDEIQVAEGIYTPDSNSTDPNGSGDRTATFQLINGVILKGGYAGFGEPEPNTRDIEEYETILSGDLDGNDIDVNDPCELLDEPTRFENSYHVITGTGTDETAILDGFTITSGNANGSERQNRRGGGMYNIDSSVTILSCTFKWNLSLGWGGGIYNSNSLLKLINCTFIENSRSGMYNYKSTLALTRCTFRHNLTPYYGGGIFNDFGTQIILIECIFIGNNSYKEGGGIFNNYGSLSSVLTNCIFVGNHAGSYGGGIFNGLNELSLTNCTFVGNSAEDEGGGFFLPPLPVPSLSYSSTAYYGYSIITNCVLWDNLPEQIVDCMDFSLVAYSDIKGGWRGFGNIDCDPCFADPNNSDYHLLEDSPCIDSGDPNYTAEPNETDLDGKPRIIGGRIDMGAYEYMPSIPAEARIIPSTINLASKGKWIICYIRLPEVYNIADINPNSVFLESEIQAQTLYIEEQKQVAIAKFRREELRDILSIGNVELTITGQLIDERIFEGKDMIRVTDKGAGDRLRKTSNWKR